jgi:hypothetical protein
MAARRRTNAAEESAAARLEALAQQALKVAKKGRKHKQNLANDNFYGNKLAELRADAAGAFSELSRQSLGDTTALAELIQSVFAPTTAAKDRLAAGRELTFTLRTTWKQTRAAAAAPAHPGFFPLTILVQTKRGYLVTIGRQMNGCFGEGWYDACAVMMRRLLEACIIEAFEGKGVAQNIRGADGNYLQLTALIDRSLSEPALTLSRNAKILLPKLRDVGHLSAHGRHFTAHRDDLEKIEHGCRVVIEEFLHHAGLL